MDISNLSELFNELRNLVLAADLDEADVNKLFLELKPSITMLAKEFHVAEMHMQYEVEPSAYELNGRSVRFDEIFSPGEGDAESALELCSEKMIHITVSCTIVPIRGHKWTDDEMRWISVVARLISIEFSRANMIRMRKKAPYTDPTTGLCNNAGISYYGKKIEALHSMKRYTGCYVNIKNFGYISRERGIKFGDDILREYAHALYNFIDPETELVARVSGDNFFALVQSFHAEDFIKLASDMKLNIKCKGTSEVVHIGAWIGTCAGGRLDSVVDIQGKSAFAAEQAKKSRMSVVAFDQDDMDDAMYEKQIAEMIPDAIKDGEILPYYQPKVLLDDGSLYGCEALSRWLHDGLLISPADFIPVAENNGLITGLDLNILEHVCRDIRYWLDMGVEPVCVSVNYSRRDFFSPTIIKDTLDIIHKYEVDGKYLEIEITESSFGERLDAVDYFVKAMHENGVKVSLDDFGTGYSSLNTFNRLDLDTVKLDKSFFEGLGRDDEKSRVILRSVAEMISQLNTVTVAEGIETEDQLRIVYEIGGHVVQGFYFDRPLTRDEFTERLRTRCYEVKGRKSE